MLLTINNVQDDFEWAKLLYFPLEIKLHIFQKNCMSYENVLDYIFNTEYEYILININVRHNFIYE